MTTRLAVNILVLNGATVLRRCLIPLKGIISELAVVDSGSTDGTQHVFEDLAAEMKLDRFYYERMHPYSQDFFTDEAESFKMSVPGPFTGRRLLKDWSAARNRALDHTHADYILKLDADDEPICPPENWLRTCDCLDARPDISVVACPYEVFDGQGNLSWLSMYDRMWRRVPTDGSKPLRWQRTNHEYLEGKTVQNTLFTAQGLRVRDWRDSPGEGLRVCHRNLKTLLYEHENVAHKVATDDDAVREGLRIYTLAHEAVPAFPEFALGLLEAVSSKLDGADVVMISDCHYQEGRALEVMGQVEAAARAYELADAVSLHTQALLCEYEMLLKASRNVTRLRERILARVGVDSPGSTQPCCKPFNCDLKIVEKVRSDCG